MVEPGEALAKQAHPQELLEPVKPLDMVEQVCVQAKIVNTLYEQATNKINPKLAQLLKEQNLWSEELKNQEKDSEGVAQERLKQNEKHLAPVKMDKRIVEQLKEEYLKGVQELSQKIASHIENRIPLPT